MIKTVRKIYDNDFIFVEDKTYYDQFYQLAAARCAPLIFFLAFAGELFGDRFEIVESHVTLTLYRLLVVVVSPV